MVRCRWCLDINCAGKADQEHWDSEKECPHEGDGEPYEYLEKIRHNSKEDTKIYREATNKYIEINFPEYWKYLKDNKYD